VITVYGSNSRLLLNLVEKTGSAGNIQVYYLTLHNQILSIVNASKAVMVEFIHLWLSLRAYSTVSDTVGRHCRVLPLHCNNWAIMQRGWPHTALDARGWVLGEGVRFQVEATSATLRAEASL